MDSVPEETHAISVMNQRLATNARLKYESRNSPLRSLIEGKDRRRKNEGNRGTSSSDRGSRIPCRFINCKNHIMCFRHPPGCHNYKSNTECSCKCHFRFVEAEEKPNTKSKKCGAQGQVALLEETVYSTEKLKIVIR